MISVLIPLLDNDELEGILYLYIPLKNISELTHDFTILWLLGGVIFITIALMLGYILINRLTRPLDEMKRAAQKVSSGYY
ncbi:cell wall metabolism sensor histidine kinase WalK [Mesobacillus maritimus]|uniref:cell wall metabolism sensor histidine kinase WalK n=1 Tax=Mesobacillus maritimus TaxID=1643336 RepID=UPI00203C4B40|nr:cell wall metabolism sensor histidine kinase WalK [Mesobacillus maritimus]MCM3668365.1 cell wall metabolism sensor histidine kinase WalK [Mesobacillus maritimus]